MMQKFDRERFIIDLTGLVVRRVPFLHQTCDPDVGMDCINIARWGFKNQGLSFPPELEKEFEAYHVVPDGQKLLAVMRQWFEELTVEESQIADLFICYVKRNPCHLAVKASNDNPPIVIEAYQSMDGHIGRLIKEPFDTRRKIAAAFRIPDFA